MYENSSATTPMEGMIESERYLSALVNEGWHLDAAITQQPTYVTAAT